MPYDIEETSTGWMVYHKNIKDVCGVPKVASGPFMTEQNANDWVEQEIKWLKSFDKVD